VDETQGTGTDAGHRLSGGDVADFTGRRDGNEVERASRGSRDEKTKVEFQMLEAVVSRRAAFASAVMSSLAAKA
jgi:hypothetical protein